MKKKSALIFGISGQDGTYLASLLLKKGYLVYGVSRDAGVNNFSSLKQHDLFQEVSLYSGTLTDFRSTLQILKRLQPDEIYNFSGQSSVGLSFDMPVETLESIATGTLNILEALRFLDYPARFYNAGSSECFGDCAGLAANEETAFRPKSPYGVAKAAAHWEVANYRDSYSLFSCTGILFNHESPIRPERFVTRKISSAAARISNGSEEKVFLGDLGVERDWGWAPEYVQAMWSMLQLPSPEDFVISTGEPISLRRFVEACFDFFNLDWKEHVVQDPSLFRPAEIEISYGDPDKAKKMLGWNATTKASQVAMSMAKSDSLLLGIKRKE